MDLLRDNLQTNSSKKAFKFLFPRIKMRAFRRFPPTAQERLALAREGKLSGMVFVSEIWRWEGETQKFVRALVDFKLVRIDDGAIAVGTARATRHSYSERDESRSGIYGCNKSNRAGSVRGMKRGSHVCGLDSIASPASFW